MGAGSFQSLLLSLEMKGMVLGNKGSKYYKYSSSNGSLWSKILAAQSMRRRQERKQKGKNNRSPQSRRALLMQRSRRTCALEGSRRHVNGVQGRVRALEKLVPNGKSMGFDGLLMETAHYISSLEMQVKLMKIMVNVLSSNEN